MAKAVLDVGNCGPDHGAITRLLENNFGAEVVQAHGLDEALQALGSRPFDLVLVNRIMDRDGSEGLEIIKRIKTDKELGGCPVMMITNFADHQEIAVEAGAEPGFGKNHLHDASTLENLGRFLNPA